MDSADASSRCQILPVVNSNGYSSLQLLCCVVRLDSSIVSSKDKRSNATTATELLHYWCWIPNNIWRETRETLNLWHLCCTPDPLTRFNVTLASISQVLHFLFLMQCSKEQCFIYTRAELHCSGLPFLLTNSVGNNRIRTQDTLETNPLASLVSGKAQVFPYRLHCL